MTETRSSWIDFVPVSWKLGLRALNIYDRALIYGRDDQLKNPLEIKH